MDLLAKEIDAPGVLNFLLSLGLGGQKRGRYDKAFCLGVH